MPRVNLPISPNLTQYAHALGRTEHPDDASFEAALAAVPGREHLLTASGMAAELLFMLDAPTLSPTTGQHLQGMQTKVRELIDRQPEVQRRLLEAQLRPYLDALALLRDVTVFQSGFVLAFLEHAAARGPAPAQEDTRDGRPGRADHR